MKQKGTSPNVYTLDRTEMKFFNELTPEKRGKGLDLLNWFQPPSATKLFTSPTPHGERLSKIEFPAVELSFEIKEVGGERQAVSSDQKTPGFYISKRQRDNRLSGYTQYLLLENEMKQKKIHLVPLPLQQLLGVFILKMGNIPTSPLLESVLKKIIDEKTGNNSKKLFTYTLNEESGKLESPDPEATLYLAMFHCAQGDFTEGLRYLQQLEDLGRRTQFSPAVFELMDQFTLPLLISQTQQAEEFFLKLSSLKIALYDISGNTQGIKAEEGCNKFTDELEKTDFKAAIVQLKFLKGDVNYKEKQIEILKNWLNTNLGMVRFFEQVHRKHGTAPLEGSDLDTMLQTLKCKQADSSLRF